VRLGRLIEAADTVVFVISPDARSPHRFTCHVLEATGLGSIQSAAPDG
jgi:hypothetical protein